jgi:ketosteroid isomerase-like protein
MGNQKMHRTSLRAAATLALVLVIPPLSEPASGAQLPVANALLAITQEMDDAIAPGNISVWDRYTDPTLIYVDENDEVSDKAKLLASMKPLPKGFSGSIRVTEFKVHDLGPIAVTTYTMAETETIEGHTIHNRYRETDTWRQTAQGWRLIAAQVMAVNKDPPSIAFQASVLVGYAGTYALSATTKQTVRVDGNHLVAERAGRPPETLLAEAPDVFFTPGKPRTRRIFLHGSDGGVTGFADRREGEDLVWRRQ